jgi:serine/threonine protein kinase
MSDQPPAFTPPPISQLAPLFSGYLIESLIATGGMGAVYRAVQKSLDRTVAIKILPREFSDDEAFCQSFEEEAKAMARLNHPNLIGVYDFGEADGMLFIVMEHVPGQSLFHSANGIAIEVHEVIRIVSGICSGLAHAHENGILHRDIKPSNILLDLNAEPKIGDFGLARPMDRKIQEGEQIFGTPHYTAPEVLKPPHTVNQRADIFSVGVLLHELLTGKLPAEDRRPASAIIRCDPRFDAIIRNATNPTPELRYTAADQITRDLQAIATSAGPRVLRTATAKTPPGSRALRPPGALAPKNTTAPRSALPTPGLRPRPVVTSQSNSIGPLVVVITILTIACVIAYVIFSGPAEPAKLPTKPSENTPMPAQ